MDHPAPSPDYCSRPHDQQCNPDQTAPQRACNDLRHLLADAWHACMLWYMPGHMWQNCSHNFIPPRPPAARVGFLRSRPTLRCAVLPLYGELDRAAGSASWQAVRVAEDEGSEVAAGGPHGAREEHAAKARVQVTLKVAGEAAQRQEGHAGACSLRVSAGPANTGWCVTVHADSAPTRRSMDTDVWSLSMMCMRVVVQRSRCT